MDISTKTGFSGMKVNLCWHSVNHFTNERRPQTSLHAAFRPHPDFLMGHTGVMLSYQTEGVADVRMRDFPLTCSSICLLNNCFLDYISL